MPNASQRPRRSQPGAGSRAVRRQTPAVHLLFNCSLLRGRPRGWASDGREEQGNQHGHRHLGSAGARTLATGQRAQSGLADQGDAGHLSDGLQSRVRRGIRRLRPAPRRVGNGCGQRVHLPPAAAVRHAGTRRSQGSGMDRSRDRTAHRDRRPVRWPNGSGETRSAVGTRR